MTTCTASPAVLHSLARRPSRATAAAIGHRYLLNGAPVSVKRQALDLLSHMVCDWSVAILDEAVTGPHCGYLVRQQALTTLRELVEQAIERGYRGLTRVGCRHLAWEAREALVAGQEDTHMREIPAVEDMCDHLNQAIEDGFFPALPDF